MKQLKSLQQVLAFYQQQLDTIKIRHQQLNSKLSEQLNRTRALTAELAETQRQSNEQPPSAANLQMANHVMGVLDNAIRQTERESQETRSESNACRKQLTDQMSKIEALEKVLERETRSIEDQRRQREQQIADERYLNTHFS